MPTRYLPDRTIHPPLGGYSLDYKRTKSHKVGLLQVLGCKSPVIIHSTNSCSHGASDLFLVPCKARGCDACAKRKRDTIARRIYYGALALAHVVQPVFLTTTWHVDDWRTTNPDYVRRVQARFMEAVRSRFCRAQSFAVREWTKAGQIHLHWVLIGGVVAPTERFFNETWASVSQTTKSRSLPYSGPISYVTHAEPVRSIKALSKYITKYVLKSLSEDVPFDFMKYRRYSFSRGWPNPPKQRTVRWHVPGTSTLEYAAQRSAAHKRIPQSQCDICSKSVTSSELGSYEYKLYLPKEQGKGWWHVYRVHDTQDWDEGWRDRWQARIDREVHDEMMAKLGAVLD